MDITADLASRSTAELAATLTTAGFELRIPEAEAFTERTQVLPFVHQRTRIPGSSARCDARVIVPRENAPIHLGRCDGFLAAGLTLLIREGAIASRPMAPAPVIETTESEAPPPSRPRIPFPPPPS